MAHFAEIDSDNIVTRVLVVPDEEEQRGQEFLAEDLGLGGTWVQTSYNGNIRGNYAGVGMTYYPDADLFMPPKPHPEAVIDPVTAAWVGVPEPEPPLEQQAVDALILDMLETP